MPPPTPAWPVPRPRGITYAASQACVASMAEGFADLAQSTVEDQLWLLGVGGWGGGKV